MKLKDCLELGKDCGLSTWEECYDNVYIHASQIFSYDRLMKQLPLWKYLDKERIELDDIDSDLYIAAELLELQKKMFKTDPDKFCKIFNSNKEDLINKGW